MTKQYSLRRYGKTSYGECVQRGMLKQLLVWLQDVVKINKYQCERKRSLFHKAVFHVQSPYGTTKTFVIEEN